MKFALRKIKKHNLRWKLVPSIFFSGIVLYTSLTVTAKPLGLLLTWQQDPTSTMTIDWHIATADTSQSLLYYKPAYSDDWLKVAATQFQFPFSDRRVNRVELTGLKPSTSYEFRMEGFSKQYSFRTMPAELDHPVRFATGGDTWFELERMDSINSAVLSHDPDFIVWGGDLAYADGLEERLYRWHQWFETNKQTLVTGDGRVIPVLAGIGNHEIRRDGGRNYWYNFESYEQTDAWRKQFAPYFLTLFAFPGQPAFGTLDFGNYLSLILLDTDHANPIEGKQTEWLEIQLRDRMDIKHVIPVYHVPAYPSHRPFDGRTETAVRQHWVPLFEQFGIRVAFENHDHTYKRTHPIRSGKVSEDGIVYFGDGAWGVIPRDGTNRNEWYIKIFESQRNAIIVTLYEDRQEFFVVNPEGEVIDIYVISLTQPRKK